MQKPNNKELPSSFPSSVRICRFLYSLFTGYCVPQLR